MKTFQFYLQRQLCVHVCVCVCICLCMWVNSSSNKIIWSELPAAAAKKAKNSPAISSCFAFALPLQPPSSLAATAATTTAAAKSNSKRQRETFGQTTTHSFAFSLKTAWPKPQRVLELNTNELSFKLNQAASGPKKAKKKKHKKCQKLFQAI